MNPDELAKGYLKIHELDHSVRGWTEAIGREVSSRIRGRDDREFQDFDLDNNYFAWKKKREAGEYTSGAVKYEEDRIKAAKSGALKRWWGSSTYKHLNRVVHEQSAFEGWRDKVQTTIDRYFPKRKKMDVDNQPNHGSMAIPKFLKGYKGLGAGYSKKRKRGSRFANKVKYYVENALQKNFPLRCLARGPTDASTGDLTSIFGAKVSLTAPTSGVGGDVLYGGCHYFWEPHSFGTGATSGDGIIQLYPLVPTPGYNRLSSF